MNFEKAKRSYFEVIMTSSTGVDGLEVVLLPAAATPYVADTWL